jgi:hypothetical protein
MSAGQAPVFKRECFPVKVAVWKNDFEGRSSYSTKLQKVYKDRTTGQWTDCDNLAVGDIPAAIQLLQMAFDYIMAQVATKAAPAAQGAVVERVEAAPF